MINIAGWDWDEYLQHLVDIGIERKKWREYMIEELYPLPGIYKTRNPASRASERVRLVAVRPSSYVHRIFL